MIMPCDTPPPPPPVDDVINEGNDEGEPDDSMYDFIDMDELDIHEVITEDDAIVTFDGHKEAVFCCNFDRTGHYVVTGGQDDTAFVWSVLNKSVKFECTGHSDTVIAASFSSDSKYVATADMNGLIQVWDVEIGAVIWDFEAFEFMWTEWLRGANILLCGSVDGNCWKWTIPDGDTKLFENPGKSSCTMGSISRNDEKLVTGYSDGTLKFWDIPSDTLLTTLTGSVAHKAVVTTIKYNVDDSLVLTGSEDGTAKLIKSSDFTVLWTIEGCDSSHHNHENVSLEDVGFCHTLPYIATGTNCGIICVWDVTTKTKRAHIQLNDPIIKIICDEFVSILYAAVGDGTLQAYDMRTGDIKKFWNGHKACIYDLAISSDRSLLLTAAEDHTCKIFERGIF